MNDSMALNLHGKNWLLLDGATGTQLHQYGLPAGVSPERWVLDHPDILIQIQLAYLEAGSNILLAFTFGANRIKLSRSLSSGESATGVNKMLASISVRVKEAWLSEHPDDVILVAGELAPTGQFLEPAGTLSFDDLVEIYQEQVRGQLEAGVDLFVAETMMDLAQTRAAVIAVQSECSLPIITSLTLEQNGRTLGGQRPEECLLTLSSMGVSAFGLNCSAGPEQLSDWIIPLAAWSPVPLLIKPNAGLPRLIDGRTVFPMNPADFAEAMKPAISAGLSLFGGCCGTEPGHIAHLRDVLDQCWGEQIENTLPHQNRDQWIASSRQSLIIDKTNTYSVIPADPDSLLDRCLDEMDTSADALIIDFDEAHCDKTDLYTGLLEEIQLMVPLPLIFRCHDESLLAEILKHYHGRAGVETSLNNIPYGALRVSC